MKLLAKYNRINIITTIVILLLSSIAYYFFIRNTLVHQLDKDLKIEEKELRASVIESRDLPEPTNLKDEQELFERVNDSLPRKFRSVEIYNNEHRENIYYRELEFYVSVEGGLYKVTVRKSQEETEDLIKLILLITLFIVIALLIALFLINRVLLRTLWKPFTDTLDQLKVFDLSQNKPLVLPSIDIEEFNNLNIAVEKMTNKAVRDYGEIRNFTENASHEIQTPLAIIKSRLELLSQGELLKEDQMENIQTIFEASNRLSRLNQSLLLLTKIDNNQFQDNLPVDISLVTNNILNNYEELFVAHHISIEKHISSPVFVKMNDALAEILVSNLVTNAIKHNIDGGFIKIEILEKQFMISNTGKSLDIPPEQLFQRFKKEKADSESLGLGLSIVKKIGETYHFKINYTCIDKVHTIKIVFN